MSWASALRVLSTVSFWAEDDTSGRRRCTEMPGVRADVDRSGCSVDAAVPV